MLKYSDYPALPPVIRWCRVDVEHEFRGGAPHFVLVPLVLILAPLLSSESGYWVGWLAESAISLSKVSSGLCSSVRQIFHAVAK